jgi:hypothetical protein
MGFMVCEVTLKQAFFLNFRFPLSVNISLMLQIHQSPGAGGGGGGGQKTPQKPPKKKKIGVKKKI